MVRAMDTEFSAHDELAGTVLPRETREDTPLTVGHLRADQCTWKVERVRITRDGEAILPRDAIVRVRRPRSIIVEEPVPQHQERRGVQCQRRRQMPFVQQFEVRL